MPQKVFIPLKSNANARLRLVCFPYAGGSSAIFANWGKKLPEDVEVFAVQLPGRGSRLAESPLTTMTQVTEQLLEAVNILQQKPCVFFGHSLGSRIALAFAQQLYVRGMRLPLHLIASGSRAPHLPWKGDVTYNLPYQQFIERLKTLNGTPVEILENTELLELFEPLLRADFQLAETFVARKLKLPLELTVFGGVKDVDIDDTDLKAWQAHSLSDIQLNMYPGDHFFIQQQEDDVIAKVSQVLSGSLISLTETSVA